MRSVEQRPEQDRFYRLRYSMAPDLLRAVSRHEADDDASGHRDQHGLPAQSTAADRDRGIGEFSEIGQIRNRVDEM
jgi:hypothetical protein